MRLIGMMDSPYVRRVAISLRMMNLDFTHEQISVFRQYEEFARINPVVKAPSLVTDEGGVLLDSTLILEYVEGLTEPALRLTPMVRARHLRSQRILGLALAACEKTVQIVYEKQLRPAEKQHQPWLDRVHQQLGEAYRLLEAEVGAQGWQVDDRPMQADITTAVVWRFTGYMLPGCVDAAAHPHLAAHSARAEALPAFRACDFT